MVVVDCWGSRSALWRNGIFPRRFETECVINVTQGGPGWVGRSVRATQCLYMNRVGRSEGPNSNFCRAARSERWSRVQRAERHSSPRSVLSSCRHRPARVLSACATSWFGNSIASYRSSTRASSLHSPFAKIPSVVRGLRTHGGGAGSRASGELHRLADESTSKVTFDDAHNGDVRAS